MGERTMRFTLRRPTDDSFDQECAARHRCGPVPKDDPDRDVVTWWPYVGGMGMPTGVWWSQESIDPCRNCGRVVYGHFSWTSDLVIF